MLTLAFYHSPVVYDLVVDITDENTLLFTTVSRIKQATKINSAYHLSLISGSTLDGYREGSKNTALFSHPKGLVQANVTTIIVADHSNDCLRWVDRETGVTSTLAGRCTVEGWRDGFGESALLASPNGLVLFNGNLFVCGRGSYAIRKVRLTDGYVSTISVLPGRPQHLTIHPLGNLLYVTVFHANYTTGLMEVDTVTGESRALSSTIGGFKDGALPESRFTDPEGIIMIKDSILLLTDHAVNMVRVVNLERSTVCSVCNGQRATVGGTFGSCSLSGPWSIATDGHTVYIGTESAVQIVASAAFAGECSACARV